MTKLLNFFKKHALVILIAFCIGAFAGYKTLERAGIAALINSIPIPEGSIADKDAFVKQLPEGSTLVQKSLVPVEKKAKNIILLI